MIAIIHSLFIYAQSISNTYWKDQKIQLIPEQIREKINIHDISLKKPDIMNAYSFSSQDFESRNKIFYIGIKTEKMIVVYYLNSIQNNNIDPSEHQNMSYEISRIKIIILQQKNFPPKSFDGEKIFLETRFYGLKEFLKFQSMILLQRSQVNFWGVPTNRLGEIEEIKNKNFENFKTIIQITEIPMELHPNYFLEEKKIHENIENKENLKLDNRYESVCYIEISKSKIFIHDILKRFETKKKLKLFENLIVSLHFARLKNKQRSYYINLKGKDFNIILMINFKLNPKLVKELLQGIHLNSHIDNGAYPCKFEISQIIFESFNKDYGKIFRQFDGYYSDRVIELEKLPQLPNAFRISYEYNWVKLSQAKDIKYRTIFRYSYIRLDSQTYEEITISAYQNKREKKFFSKIFDSCESSLEFHNETEKISDFNSNEKSKIQKIDESDCSEGSWDFCDSLFRENILLSEPSSIILS